jgi:hypothetical protein
MPAIEGKIKGFVQNRIRSLKALPIDGDGASSVGSAAGAAKQASVREARFSDFEQVRALNLRLGQGPDSIENWHRLWRDNPALSGSGEGTPIGWVLEESNEIMGFLGSIPLQYEFAGSPVRAVTTCRFAVETAYRAYSHLLVVSFFRQKNVDLFLNATATVAAGKIMTALRASPLPQPDYGTVLFWVVEPRRFSKEVLKKLGVKASLVGTGSAIASLALRTDSAMRGRRARVTSSKYKVQEMDVLAIGSAVESLWRDYLKRAPELFARRTTEIMRWHFDPPANRRKVSAFGSFEGTEMVGYVVVRHDGPETEDIRRSTVADLLAKRDDQEIIESLFAAAVSSAKYAGSDVLELMGFPARIRKIFLQWKPYSRKYPANPFFYKTSDATLSEKLTKESSWYASPFDGDATLWP